MSSQPPLPRGWCWATISELCANEPNSLTVGPSGPHFKISDHVDSGPRVVRPSNVGIGEFDDSNQAHITKRKFLELQRHEIHAGDLVIAAVPEPVGRCCQIPASLGPAIVHADCIRLRTHPFISARFIMHALNSPQGSKRAEASSHSTSRLRINLDNIRNLMVPLAPASEQNRIVARIEPLLFRNRHAKETLASIPILLEQFRQSVLAAAFRGALTASWRSQLIETESASKFLEGIRIERRRRWEAAEPSRLERNEKTRRTGGRRAQYDDPSFRADLTDPRPECFGDLDSLGWSAAPLELLTDPMRGISYGLVQAGDPHPAGIPMIRSGDIKNFSIELGSLKRVDPRIASQYSRTRLEGGEVLVALKGTIGGIAIASPAMAGMNISREIAMVPTLPGVLPRFLMYFLASPVATRMLSQGVSQTVVNLDDLRSLPVPLPSTAEQQEIVNRIDKTFSHVLVMQERWKQATEQIRPLQEAILSQAFRGELVSQNPSDEPASVLVERICAERKAAASSAQERGHSHQAASLENGTSNT